MLFIMPRSGGVSGFDTLWRPIIISIRNLDSNDGSLWNFSFVIFCAITYLDVILHLSRFFHIFILFTVIVISKWLRITDHFYHTLQLSWNLFQHHSPHINSLSHFLGEKLTHRSRNKTF